MAESSLVESDDDQQLLQAALEHPFEPTQVPLATPPPPVPDPTPPPAEPTPAPTESDTWQSDYASQVSEWRAQSASARAKAELTRTEWEALRARETAERVALGQPAESWDSLGDHITTSTAAATQIVALSASVTSLGSAEHVSSRAQAGESAERAVQPGKTEGGSPCQPWEHISSSPTSSYPSMSFPDASPPHSPALVACTATPHASADTHPPPPPSTLPAIMDDRLAPRTRLSLVLSSLAINLFLPFVNGVMLGFGEIFAKDVVMGWFGWRRRGSTAAGLGLWR